MKRKYLVLGIVLLLAALPLASSNAAATEQSQLVTLACGNGSATPPDSNPQLRSAATNVIQARWFNALDKVSTPPTQANLDKYQQLLAQFARTAGRFNGVHPSGAPECRAIGATLQFISLISVAGDPLVKGPDGRPLGPLLPSAGSLLPGEPLINPLIVQAYADAVSRAPTPERGLVWANAVMGGLIVNSFFNPASGRFDFGLLPGGLHEAFRRVQSCLQGALVTNQGNKWGGVTLDCSQEAIRRAMVRLAPTIYAILSSDPTANFGCEALRKQAEQGKTVEARWAAAEGFMFGLPFCVMPSVSTLSRLAVLSKLVAGGGSVELRFMAVAPLIFELSRQPGADAETFLAKARTDSTAELRLADAWAAGLLLAPQLMVNPVNCNPTTRDTGDLFQFSEAHLGSELAQAAIAPLTRYFSSQVKLPSGGGNCLFIPSSEAISMTIRRTVPGAKIPLQVQFVISNNTTIIGITRK